MPVDLRAQPPRADSTKQELQIAPDIEHAYLKMRDTCSCVLVLRGTPVLLMFATFQLLTRRKQHR